MKMHYSAPQQPPGFELQALQQLIQQGQLLPAEAKAQQLLQKYPKSMALLNMLGVSQQGLGKYPEAISCFRKMLAMDRRIAELHFNIAVLQAQLGDHPAAITSYQQALTLKPGLTLAHFNLGGLLQAAGQLVEAEQHYRKALEVEPTFVEALGNLGAVLQLRGHLQDAEQCYLKALALRPDARGHFNLGTTLHDQGRHTEAANEFRAAVALDPHFADAWNDLGETLRDRGEMQEAMECYRQALNAQAQHARALYNLGESLCLAERLEEAIPYFAQSNFADAQERVLQCLYKTRQFELYAQKFIEVTQHRAPTSILLGTLATHYATNFGVENHYGFCRQPMDYVQHTHIAELAAPESEFLKELLHDIQHLAIAERKQGRLYYGMQSAGNLLLRSEPAIQKLAALIRAKVMAYRQHFAASTEAIITQFPQQIEFTSSWYLRMRQGGYLTSHIHEEGWISGCVYLQLPDKNNTHAGSFEYSIDGDDYPRLHDNFPSQIVDQAVGDLVLFPSSLFHRTIPFDSAEERVCVAFDVKPASS